MGEILHQLRLVAYAVIYEVLIGSRWCRISSINSILYKLKIIFANNLEDAVNSQPPVWFQLLEKYITDGSAIAKNMVQWCMVVPVKVSNTNPHILGWIFNSPVHK